jgi:chromosome segregation ATPase
MLTLALLAACSDSAADRAERQNDFLSTRIESISRQVGSLSEQASLLSHQVSSLSSQQAARPDTSGVQPQIETMQAQINQLQTQIAQTHANLEDVAEIKAQMIQIQTKTDNICFVREMGPTVIRPCHSGE